jgi:hypothetical protein
MQIRNKNGIYLVVLKCQCDRTNCQVDLYRITNQGRNYQYILTIPSTLISDNSNVKALKLSRNGNILIIITRNNINKTNTLLQYFSINLASNQTIKIR